MKQNKIININLKPENSSVKEIPKNFRFRAGQFYAQKSLNIVLSFTFILVIVFAVWLYSLNRHANPTAKDYAAFGNALIIATILGLIIIGVHKIEKIHGQNSISSLQQYIKYEIDWRSKIFDDTFESKLQKETKRKHFILWELLTTEEKKYILTKGYKNLPPSVREAHSDKFLDGLLNPEIETNDIKFFVDSSGCTTNAYVRTTMKIEELQSYLRILETT